MLSYLSNKIDIIRAKPPLASHVAFLQEQHFAHRGLHGGGNNDAPLENSMAAFEAALQAGYGIECDVQPSADGVAMVFHDSNLKRLTGHDGLISHTKTAHLRAMALNGDNGNIPTLEQVVTLVARQQPILIEIKSDVENFAPLCLSVRRALEGYRGKAVIMSFNPAIVRWFRKTADHVICGLVISEKGKKGLLGRAKRHMDMWLAKPDFLAYDIRDLPSNFARNQRARGIPILTWTVRTQKQIQTAKKYSDAMIFETSNG